MQVLVARFLDMRRMHQPLANITLANYFCDETVRTMTDLCQMTCLDEQIALFQALLLMEHGLPLYLFVCGDLHMLRCLLDYVIMDRCPFCEADPSKRLLKQVPFLHYVYDSDHMICNIVTSLWADIYRKLPLNLRYHF